jgi:hypothetical protein
MTINDKMKSQELKNLCKEYGVKCTGTKNKLIQRINIARFIHDRVDKNFKQNSIPKSISMKDVDGNLSSSVETFQKFYSFVSKKNSNEIIGKIDNLKNNNKIIGLTKADIDYCKNRNMKYSIPIILEGEHMTHRTRTTVDDDEGEDEDEEFGNE